MAANDLLLPLLSGLILLASVVGILRLRRWRRNAGVERPDRSAEGAIADALQSPTAWTAVFLVLVVVSLAGTLALVGALPMSEAAQSVVGTVLLVGVGLVLAGFVFLGVYTAVRNRGHGSAPAVGLGSLVVGLLMILVVVAQLFLG